MTRMNDKVEQWQVTNNESGVTFRSRFIAPEEFAYIRSDEVKEVSTQLEVPRPHLMISVWPFYHGSRLYFQTRSEKRKRGPSVLYHGKRWYGPCSDASFAQSRNPGMVFMFTVER